MKEIICELCKKTIFGSDNASHMIRPKYHTGCKVIIARDKARIRARRKS